MHVAHLQSPNLHILFVVVQQPVLRRWLSCVHFGILMYKREEKGCRSVVTSKPAVCAQSKGVSQSDYMHECKLLMNFK